MRKDAERHNESLMPDVRQLTYSYKRRLWHCYWRF